MSVRLYYFEFPAFFRYSTRDLYSIGYSIHFIHTHSFVVLCPFLQFLCCYRVFSLCVYFFLTLKFNRNQTFSQIVNDTFLFVSSVKTLNICILHLQIEIFRKRISYFWCSFFVTEKRLSFSFEANFFV